MNKLIARLAASATLVAGMGGTAFASGSASLDVTGPGSVNVIDFSHTNRVNTNIQNWVNSANWNWQSARSGNVDVRHNTEVWGGGSGSGNAWNMNRGDNSVSISNDGLSGPMFWGGGGGGDAFIGTTGPDSFNRISLGSSNRVTNNTTNDVRSINSNSQNAVSGGVRISGNTVVRDVGGSGNAFNVNSGTNTVDISNQGMGNNWVGGSGGDTNARIGITGPDSTNIIRSNNNNSFSQRTVNDVSSANFNQQSARSGNVVITGNTVVEGVGGSGSAANFNSGSNDTGISNN